MNLTLGFSPCPNDTFIFDALVNGKIDTKGFRFTVSLDDVETLNRNAINVQTDITKLSYGVLPLVTKDYIVLNSGSALGTGVGPLLVSAEAIKEEELNNYTIAIPGENTTAHMLFSLAYPTVTNKRFLRYDEIEDFVLSSKGKAAGVLIHENRFTYMDRGLVKIKDLGEYWETTTGNPIPLGGIVMKRTIDPSIIREVDALIKESIRFAYSNYPVLGSYIKDHAQEMSEDVMRKHIDLYVNDYSVNLGQKGKEAIMQVMQVYDRLHHKEDQSIPSAVFAAEPVTVIPA